MVISAVSTRLSVSLMTGWTSSGPGAGELDAIAAEQGAAGSRVWPGQILVQSAGKLGIDHVGPTGKLASIAIAHDLSQPDAGRTTRHRQDRRARPRSHEPCSPALEPLRRELAKALPERPFALRFWDGTELPATSPDGPVFTVRSPTAVAHLLRAPGQLGLGRAYAAGELEADDLDRVIGLLDSFRAPAIDRATRLRLTLAAARACGLTRPPRIPASELRPRGARHSRARDARAVRHHYDVSNDFFTLFLDSSMTYSCALFSRGATTLEEAQVAKRELVCTKLALREGERLLDVGCGWGSFVLHAAARHGVRAVGITLSPNQAELARRRVAKAGLEDRVEIRLADYRDLGTAGERFDAIA